jgi:toxin ParE1/3/4
VTPVRWTPQAAEDLAAIRDFIARDSPRYARIVVERIVSAVDILEQFPLSGKIVPERSWEDLRELVRPPYRIVYRVLEDRLDIVTVFRSSRETPDVL